MRVKRAFSFSFALRSFFGNFEPELDGSADVGQRFIMRRVLTVAAGQCGARNGETFIGFNHDNRVLRGEKIRWLKR